MVKFKKKCLEKNVAVNCKTKKQAKQLLTWATSKGFKWCDGNSYPKNTGWDTYGENVCYYLYEGMYSGNIRANKGKYKILSFKEALKKPKIGYYGHDKFDGGDSRSSEWEKQRKTRGFDDTELWSLGDTIVKFTLPRLIAFDVDNNYVSLIAGLKIFIRDKGSRIWSTKESEQVHKALKELGPVLPYLWN